jgi:hypothetical protein
MTSVDASAAQAIKLPPQLLLAEIFSNDSLNSATATQVTGKTTENLADGDDIGTTFQCSQQSHLPVRAQL